MALTQPQSLPFKQVLAQIESGLIKIPQFQRDFVWSRAESAKLLDSIVKGYPIGTFILWNTDEQLRVVRNLGGVTLPDTPPGQFTNHVLDGQQRLTSLYAAIRGLAVDRGGQADDFGDICVSLIADPDSDEPVVLPSPPEGMPDADWVRLTDLFDGEFEVLSRYPAERRSRLKQHRDTLTGYTFSVVIVQNAPIEVATEIFTRLNVGGRRLSTFEIMVAKTYDPDRDFDLAEKYIELKQRLAKVHYGTIPSAVVLQTVGALHSRAIKAKDILRIPRQDFIDTWPRAVGAIDSAVDFLRGYFGIPVSKLLPYPHLVVPFAYFFSKHPDPPQDFKKELLQDFFWRVALTSWYSRSVESRIESDLTRIDRILRGEQPAYEVGVNATPRAIQEHGWFRTGRAWIKGILCLMAWHQPRSFANHSLVRISNDWLKQANSRNYHHFFPKAWAKKNGHADDWRINHIANITIVDDFLNKRTIRAKAPSVYMDDFRKKNSNLAATMATHLIDIKADGVFDDDWETFFANRCTAISAALTERLILLPIDEQQPAVPESDEEEDIDEEPSELEGEE